ncbi:MAG: 1,6-anhydro-N-acetylmuramyl-L-alanine amidase AmpD [Gammaproteobacteria bacterium]|uniref:1,6-anhydro-N-acetylmuramyl-L-alanine amidase AmpD n=1 Tax=Candidatus Thiopontia autotrophica TaxID=2841688 RepID=A0A8J6NZZ7_9GAMM|nr:1,6-anhydro-N-acetylmuramyl-L-alanine amidase AmpD [Candidatus Thiopontia autotrophica]MBL6969227.1 1,6-anhydro-N-acetylmuramyl-L-alanine amidase AmpD [Gammaproteobacteria bacterium]
MNTSIFSIDGGGWIIEADKVSSPNCDERPDGDEIDLLVVHGISLPAGKFGTPYIDQLFTNQLDTTEVQELEALKDLRVSAHLLIHRDGRLVQYVPLSKRAWHAGVSSFRGRERCNDFSIGVELEGSDYIAYTDIQYNRLASLIAAIKREYPQIVKDRIVGHSDIAPGRKSDPGPAFEWERLFEKMETKL